MIDIGRQQSDHGYACIGTNVEHGRESSRRAPAEAGRAQPPHLADLVLPHFPLSAQHHRRSDAVRGQGILPRLVERGEHLTVLEAVEPASSQVRFLNSYRPVHDASVSFSGSVSGIYLSPY